MLFKITTKPLGNFPRFHFWPTLTPASGVYRKFQHIIICGNQQVLGLKSQKNLLLLRFKRLHFTSLMPHNDEKPTHVVEKIPLLIQSRCYSCSLLVPPSNLEVDIQPKPQFAKNTIWLAEGRAYTATCKTSFANPLPSYTWNVTGTSSLSSPQFRIVGWILTSIVTITPNGTHHRSKTLSCYADNGIGAPATLTTTFTIFSEYLLCVPLLFAVQGITGRG